MREANTRCAVCGESAHYQCSLCHALFCGKDGCAVIPKSGQHPCEPKPQEVRR